MKKGNTDLTYENFILPESMILLDNLKKYLLKTNKSLVICCKNFGFKLEAEKYFYKKFFENINFSISTNAESISDDDYFNSYKNLIKSEVVIGLPSTLLREAFFYKKKILCFDYSNLENHPFKNISLCNKRDYQSFDQKLNCLFKTNYIIIYYCLNKISTCINKSSPASSSSFFFFFFTRPTRSYLY